MCVVVHLKRLIDLILLGELCDVLHHRELMVLNRILILAVDSEKCTVRAIFKVKKNAMVTTTVHPPLTN